MMEREFKSVWERVWGRDRHMQCKKTPSADWWGTKGGRQDGGGEGWEGWKGWVGCLNVTGSEVR